MKLLDQMRCFHCDGDTGAIIDRACSQVPGIKMPRDDYDLLRMFASLDVGDDICAFDIG